MSGHLFESRYKAIVVHPDEGDYLVTLSDYVHLNPVRAGLLRAGASSLIIAGAVTRLT